jgi:AraC family transcriptional activator of pobA
MSAQLIIKDKIETEKSIKIAPFKKGVRKTEPHKHNNYFEIIYLSDGSGHHYIDLNKYIINPPVVFFIRQEQVHYWEIDSEPEGFVIIIRKSFIEKMLDNELKKLFSQASGESCLQLPQNNTIEQLLLLLEQENNNHEKYSLQVTEGLLKSLLAKVLEVTKQGPDRNAHRADLFHSFIQLVSVDNGIKHTVAFYARKLHTTPQNINAICQKNVQQQASEVIAGFVIMEAKRLLLYTDQSVSEISVALDFTDSSHFVKYFKRIVGCTPKLFRGSNG